MNEPAPPRRREVELDPALQAQLLEQMREEQQARGRARLMRNFVLLPVLVGVTGMSLMMAFSSDLTTAIIGQTLASSILFVVWKVRKRLASLFGD